MAVTLTRAAALAPTTNLDQAGAVFNDATRLLDGGLWSTPVNDGHNQTPYLPSYLQDINAIHTDIGNALANGITIGGQPFTPSAADTTTLQHVQTELTSLAAAAPHAIGPAGNGGADSTLHNTQLNILNEINGSPTLSAALHNAAYTANTGATDNPFQAVAAPNATPADLAAAAHGTLAQIGAVFNTAANSAIGGVDLQHAGSFNNQMQSVATGVHNILNNPAQLAAIEQGQAPADAALTTIHLQTLENQANLQTHNFTNPATLAANPTVAARGTNDNILDMIDIVQGDPALNKAAGGNGADVTHNSGFASQPGYLTGTITHYQDNQAQTNFWSQFVSGANNLNTGLQNVANGTHATPADIAQLTTDLHNYQAVSQSFAAGQGGVFSGRFNNELVNGTVNADTAAALHGLQTHDNAQLMAAGVGFAANAMDVSGNNTPLHGTNYVADATTAATATNPNGLANGTIPVPRPGNGQGQGMAMNGQGNANDPNHHTNPMPVQAMGPADPNHHTNPMPVDMTSHNVAANSVQDMTHAANTAVDFSHMWHHA